MRVTNSGPARTVKVLYNNVWISIDLVPVFYLSSCHLRKHKLREFPWLSKVEHRAFLVPKPLSPELSRLLPPHMADYVWRVHFPEAEQKLIVGNTCIRKLIKIAKALRDKQDWPVPSYFLKVVALWMLKDYPSESFWEEEEIGTLFIKYLEYFQKFLHKQHLGHLFYPEFNLLHSFKKKHFRSLYNRIENIIMQLKNNPDSAMDLFKTACSLHAPFVPSLFKKDPHIQVCEQFGPTCFRGGKSEASLSL